jgi:hypothetical protein
MAVILNVTVLGRTVTLAVSVAVWPSPSLTVYWNVSVPEKVLEL